MIETLADVLAMAIIIGATGVGIYAGVVQPSRKRDEGVLKQWDEGTQREVDRLNKVARQEAEVSAPKPEEPANQAGLLSHQVKELKTKQDILIKQVADLESARLVSKLSKVVQDKPKEENK